MIRKIHFNFILFLAVLVTGCHRGDTYEVYALRYEGSWRSAAKNAIIGANPADSLEGCNMFWLLKSGDGRNILVDAGYVDTSRTPGNTYIRPDKILQRMNLSPDEISDIIMTHPHWDHIGGVVLFPKAKVWMQKDDYDYLISKSWLTDGHSRGYREYNVSEILEISRQGRVQLVDGDSLEIMPGIRVFTGSRHSFNNQYLLVSSGTDRNRILLASDAIWYYYNLDHLLPATLIFDPEAYVKAMKRMKTLVTDPDLIVPGHDNLVFSRFPEVAEGIVRIRK